MLNFVYAIYGQLGKLLRLKEQASHPAVSEAESDLPGHTLYQFWVSYYSTKARKAIYKMGVRIPFKDVLLDPVAYQELVEKGGKDQVPCLRIDGPGGTKWMYETVDIIAYLKSAPRKKH